MNCPMSLSMLSHSKHHRCIDVPIQYPPVAAPSCKPLRGVNVGEIDLKKLRESISLVPQADDLEGFRL